MDNRTPTTKLRPYWGKALKCKFFRHGGCLFLFPLTLTLSRQGRGELRETLFSQGRGEAQGPPSARGEGNCGRPSSARGEGNIGNLFRQGRGNMLTWSVASEDLSMERVCGESPASGLNTGKLKR